MQITIPVATSFEYLFNTEKEEPNRLSLILTQKSTWRLKIMLREKFTENLNYSQFFSFEVLDYFNSICTDENYKWIVKYFNVLMKKENKTAEKFNNHHIRPAFTFRDDNHKNRKETKSLANEVNGNIIRLSVQNHIKAHNYLRFIFKNTIYEGYARSAIYIICRKRNVENFT